MAQPASLTGASKPPPGGEDHTQLFAQMVARTAKDIEVKILKLIFAWNCVAGFGGFITKWGEHPGVAGWLLKKKTEN